MTILLGDNVDNGTTELFLDDTIYVVDREGFSTPIVEGTADQAVIKVSTVFGGNIMIMVYDSGGNLLANTASTPVSNGINTIPLETPLEITSANAPYRMAVWMSANNEVLVDSVQTRTGSDKYTAAYTGTAPATLPGSASYENSGGRVYLYLEQTEPAIQTITDIDTDESVYPGQSFVTTGTNFGATQGTGTVDIDGVAQTVTAWSDTSITCTAVRGGNEYGTGKTLTVTTDAGTTATLTVAQEAEPNTFAVTAASPNTTDPASLWSGLVDTSTGDPVTVVDGDQAWVKDPNSLGNLSITPAGAISADTTGEFVVQFWKASEEVWGSDQTVSFELPGAASGAVPDVTIDAIPPVERLIAGEGKNNGRLVPKLSTTRLATSSIAFGKQNTAAPPFDAGLPYLTQPIRVQIADFFDTGAVTEIRMPSGTAILGVHAIVLEAFDLTGASTMRMVTDQGTIVSGLDFSSTGWKLPTSYGDINAPTGLRARNVTLEPSDQTVTGSETTGDAYVFFSYIYR